MNPNQSFQSPEPNFGSSYGQTSGPVGSDNNFKRIVVILVVLVVVGLGGLFLLSNGNNGTSVEVSEDIDTQLQNDLARLRGDIGAYNFVYGEYPDYSSEFIEVVKTEFIEEEFISPITGEAYVIRRDLPQTGEFQYFAGAICAEDGSMVNMEYEDSFAVRTILTDGTSYCLDKRPLASEAQQ